MFAQGQFLIDPNAPPEEIVRKRAALNKVMRAYGRANNIGEGVGDLLTGIGQGVQNRRVTQAERAQSESANSAFDSLFGGGDPAAPTIDAGGFPSAPSSPGFPPAPASPSGTVQVPASSGSSASPDVAELEAYIRESATKRGIDPDVAVRVARSEGLAPGVWQSNVVKNGQRETSYGPFQLLVGGGLGDKFQETYGKSPADPSTVRQQIDFALDEAAQGGWGPWYGAAKVGVDTRTGLDNARALGYQPEAAPSLGQPQTAADAVTAMAAGADPDLPQRNIPVSNMNPLMFARDGASRMTNRNAVTQAQGVIDGPYEMARRQYKIATGNETLPPINDMIAKVGTSRERNTPNSQHFAGKAIDFGTRGMSDIEKVALNESLDIAGFNGRGFGQNILHADTRGNPAGWSYGNSQFAGRPVSEFVGAAASGQLPQDLTMNGRPMPGAPVPQPRPDGLAGEPMPVERAPLPMRQPTPQAQPPISGIQATAPNMQDMAGRMPAPEGQPMAQGRDALAAALMQQQAPAPAQQAIEQTAPQQPEADPRAQFNSSQLNAADPTRGILKVLMERGGQRAQANPAVSRVQQAMQGQGGTQNIGKLIELANNPFLSEGKRAVIASMVERTMKAQDPEAQLDLEMKQLQLEQMRNPQADVPESVRALQMRAEAAGLQPGTPEYSNFMVSGGKGPLVTVDNRGSSKYNDEIDKNFAQQYIDLQNGAQAAQNKIATLQGLQDALGQSSFTGMGAETLLGVKQAARSLGIDIGADLGPEETARALGNQLALQMRSPSNGAGMPGAMSDKDREFLVASVPGLGKTPEGNARLIDFMTRVEQRNIQVAQMAQDYQERNGQLNNGFYQELSAWSAQNPLFPEANQPQKQNALPDGVSEEDIQHTMQIHGLTREQVLERLNAN